MIRFSMTLILFYGLIYKNADSIKNEHRKNFAISIKYNDLEKIEHNWSKPNPKKYLLKKGFKYNNTISSKKLFKNGK